MQSETLIAFIVVAWITIATPGPATLLSLRNGAAYGAGAVLWSAWGNVIGVLFLSSTAILGLGVVLSSSAMLFNAVKIIGALYLFYIGVRSLFNRSAPLAYEIEGGGAVVAPSRRKLITQTFMISATNPKGLLFFSALFPQFINAKAPLVPQFLILTGIFMGLAYVTHVLYAVAASRARHFLQNPSLTKWFDRVVGTTFIAFGALLLTVRR